MRPTGILICVPAMGQQMCAATALSLFTTAQFLAAKNINTRMTWYAAADIEDVRNLFVTVWYDGHPEFSHMLFVDADMGFEPELVRDFIRFDKPLVGALYAKRKMPASIVGTVPEGHSAADVVHGFIPATGLGCGVMMISREVITTMLRQMPELSDPIPSSLAEATPDLKLTRIIRAFDKMRDGDRRLSEDMAFCYRWQQCGGEVWANVNHKISHIGPFDFHMRYGGVLAAKTQAEKQDEAA
jgi:hypothetical protein